MLRDTSEYKTKKNNQGCLVSCCVLSSLFKSFSTFSIFSIFILFLSCSSQDSANAPYKSYVLYLDTSQSTLGTPYYTLGVKDLSDLADISVLDGTYFSIKEGGTMEVDVNEEGELISAERFKSGATPNLRYKVKDGLIIPKDYNSLILLSVFYQFQEIFSNLEQYTGVNPGSIVEKARDRKISIWYEPVIVDKHENKSSSTSEVAKLNAAFIPGQKQFVLFQRSSLERVPLAANLSVIAHEFGHALFEYVFYSDNYDEKEDKDFEIYPISGINEGFADYISYIYTGVSNILGSSFLFAKDYIQRDFAVTTFTYDKIKANIITSTFTSKETDISRLKDTCTGGYYCYGTLLARSFWQAARSSGYDGERRFEYLKKIFEALSHVREILKPQTDQFYSDVETQGTDKKEIDDYKVLSLFLQALLTNFDPLLRDNLCSSLAKNFDTVMSKQKHSAVCPNTTFKVNKNYFWTIESEAKSW